MARETAASMGLRLCLAMGAMVLWSNGAQATDANAGDGGAGQTFARLDRNRDGMVDFAEMRRARDGWVDLVDRNGDGRISRDEFLTAPPHGPDGRVGALHRARRAKVFARIDMNGDGHIDQAEREASLKRWFARRDLNGDGRLSYEELRAARKRWQAWRGEEPIKRAQRGGTGQTARKHPPKRPRGIARFDRNADGAVSFAELSVARAGRMEAIDRNRDGRVSFDEFVNRGDDSAGGPQSRRRSWRARLFVRIDRNRDGYITPDEHARALRRWFERMDTDRDGLISAEEMATARARWRARRRALREAD
jgi:Ca2+-binding EF-hand superfamily protein